MLQQIIKSSLFTVCSSHRITAFTYFYRNNSTRCIYHKQSRSTFPRMYKTKMFLEDGSSMTVRCKIPRKFIQLPLDFDALDDNEQRKVWLSRKTRIETTTEIEETDDFDSSKYKKFWK